MLCNIMAFSLQESLSREHFSYFVSRALALCASDFWRNCIFWALYQVRKGNSLQTGCSIPQGITLLIIQSLTSALPAHLPIRYIPLSPKPWGLSIPTGQTSQTGQVLSPAKRGEEPTLTLPGRYELKLYNRHSLEWYYFQFAGACVSYLSGLYRTRKMLSPVAEKAHRKYLIRFCFEEKFVWIAW